ATVCSRSRANFSSTSPAATPSWRSWARAAAACSTDGGGGGCERLSSPVGVDEALDTGEPAFSWEATLQRIKAPISRPASTVPIARPSHARRRAPTPPELGPGPDRGSVGRTDGGGWTVRGRVGADGGGGMAGEVGRGGAVEPAGATTGWVEAAPSSQAV